jgi:hypothetical protein
MRTPHCGGGGDAVTRARTGADGMRSAAATATKAQASLVRTVAKFARSAKPPFRSGSACPKSNYRRAVFRKMVRPFIAGAGAIGALALLNRGLAVGLPINHLAGSGKRWRWNDFELFAACCDVADDGALVLLVHAPGLCGSSYEYRRLFPLLGAARRVVAFDFLGCGLSEKPPMEYAPDIFVDQIIDAAVEFGGQGVTVIASGLGAAYAIRSDEHGRLDPAGGDDFKCHADTVVRRIDV